MTKRTQKCHTHLHPMQPPLTHSNNPFHTDVPTGSSAFPPMRILAMRHEMCKFFSLYLFLSFSLRHTFLPHGSPLLHGRLVPGRGKIAQIGIRNPTSYGWSYRKRLPTLNLKEFESFRVDDLLNLHALFYYLFYVLPPFFSIFFIILFSSLLPSVLIYFTPHTHTHTDAAVCSSHRKRWAPFLFLCPFPSLSLSLRLIPIKCDVLITVVTQQRPC